MATVATFAPRFTSVVVAAATDAARRYQSGRESAALAAGFASHTALNMHFFGGRTIEHLTFTNVYLGGKTAWQQHDISAIDASLSASMEDPHLNNVIAQYFKDGKAAAAFKPSRVLDGPLPLRVFRDTVEGFVAALDQSNGLSGFNLGSSVFCFMLPKGTVLVDGDSAGGAKHHADHDDDEHGGNLAANEHDEASDSKHGLGGYHGSIHARRGGGTDTVYYAVGVYAEGTNGIVAFDKPWKNVCATFYHELQEARTDPDVEDAIRAGNDPHANDFLGWYSPRGGEIGDIPLDEAGPDLSTVMKEVPIVKGGTAPIQLMWSNAVGGPEGPIATKHKAAKAKV
ncbi:MAG TPA: hypothetical protein VGH82_04125 [Gaiellaceae bacterium]|jgi:hypothetical protein